MMCCVVCLQTCLVDAVHPSRCPSSLHAARRIPSPSLFHRPVVPGAGLIRLVIEVVVVLMVMVEPQARADRYCTAMRVRGTSSLVEDAGLRVDLVVFADFDPSGTYA